MENEVIIDGCNVAECECFRPTYNEDEIIIKEFCSYTYALCHQRKNCYFKQFQRAKAELEQYKKSKQASYEYMQIEWNKARNELKDIKKENARLKVENEKLLSELQQRYDEPDFKTFRLMGKTVTEWKNIKAENEKLKFFKQELSKPIYLPTIDEPEVINKYNEVINKYKQALEELKKENEELKENKQRLVKMYERFKYTKKANYQYKKQIPRYKQALEDIREDLNNSCWESADIGIKNRILNKIDEVLKNDSIN